MAEAAGTNIPEYSLDFTGGQDASRDPSIIDANKVHKAVNISFRKGKLQGRPSLKKKKLTFTDKTYEDNNGVSYSYEKLYYSGKFQASIPYIIGYTPYFIEVVSGRIFLINRVTFFVDVLEIEDGSYINENADRVYWSPAGNYLVIHDYPALPVIFDGLTVRRSDPALYEVPVSVFSTYNYNRLWITNAGNEFTAGDPTSPSFPRAPITFEEISANSAPYIGQVFQLNTDMFNRETITAMTFLQQTDTGTGIGPLLVSTAKAIYSYQSQNPRNQWETGQFGSVFNFNMGIAGPRAFTHTNSDFYFIGSDGKVRSGSMAREEQKKWSRTPMSGEVDDFLQYWDTDLIKYATMLYHDNRIYATTNPYRVQCSNTKGTYQTDIVHAGMVVMEFANMAILGQEAAPPIWAGLWTGVRISDWLQVDNKAYIFGKDESNRNSIWEIGPDGEYDEDENYRKREIVSTFIPREYSFKDPFQDKKLVGADFPLKEISGKLSIKLEYKPSHYPNFVKWDDKTHNAPYSICEGEFCSSAKHDLKELFFGSPADSRACDPVSKQLLNTFKELLIRVTIRARSWSLNRFAIKAVAQTLNLTPNTCTKLQEDVKLCASCDEYWNIEDFNQCQ